MKILISPFVHQAIDEFYDYALQNHETLDEITVIKKKDRLYDTIESLRSHARIHSKARLKQDWIDNGFYECIIENFHFAYYVAKDKTGEDVVIVADACHSLLYHN